MLPLKHCAIRPNCLQDSSTLAQILIDRRSPSFPYFRPTPITPTFSTGDDARLFLFEGTVPTFVDIPGAGSRLTLTVERKYADHILSLAALSSCFHIVSFVLHL